MELLNFSSAETRRINRALGFISSKEVDLEPLLARTLIVKTEHYADECEQLAPYFAPLGLEDGSAHLVFNSAKDGMHKILLNKETISGLSSVYSIIAQVVHLGNLRNFSREHGNIYRLDAAQAIANHYYEFLLWTRFQAMKIATRAHALLSWHEVNGEEPPQDGRYQFSQVGFPVEPVGESLYQLVQAGDVAAWREGFWGLLEELANYFGRLAFYQQTANPSEVDERFPADAIGKTVGLENCLMFYASLQAARDYKGWTDMRAHMRKAVVAMQDLGKARFDKLSR
ncbi:MAG: hypothetical protein PHI97_22405 [Desulfobulbus sp.]|nr:hypothetical protein [Desulfobulbus sp.]